MTYLDLTDSAPHAFQIEGLWNPGTAHEYWRRAMDTDEFDSLDEARRELDLLLADGYAVDHLRITAIVALPDDEVGS